MKRVKVIAGLVAVMALMSVMTGCGDKENTDTTSTDNSVVTTVAKEQGENKTTMTFFKTPDECDYLRNPEYCIYYTDSMTEDKAEVYYNQGTWLMYSADKFTQLQQYCVTDVNKTLKEVAESFETFNAETVTYSGYTTENQILNLEGDTTFKAAGVDYIFIEWINGEYSYSYTYQSGDVSVYSIFADSMNLFREYSKVYEQYMQEQGAVTTPTGGEGTVTETTTVSADGAVTEAATVNEGTVESVAESETTAVSSETVVSE